MALLRNCFAWSPVVETADVLCSVCYLAFYSEWHQLEITLGINAATCHMWSPSGNCACDCEGAIQEALMPTNKYTTTH